MLIQLANDIEGDCEHIYISSSQVTLQNGEKTLTLTPIHMDSKVLLQSVDRSEDTIKVTSWREPVTLVEAKILDGEGSLFGGRLSVLYAGPIS